MGQNCCTPGEDGPELTGAAAGGTVPSHKAASAPMAEEVVKSSAPTVEAPAAAAPKPKPKPAATASAPAPKAAAGGSSSGAKKGLTFELVLEDLNKAEELAYGSAFAGFADGAATVGMDSAKLRDFVASNTGLAFADIDEALIKACNEDMQLTQPKFLELLRSNAIAEGMVLERFLGLASDGDGAGESINISDCRTGLFMIKDELGATADTVGEGRWDAVLDTVLRTADVNVDMESWTSLCKEVARIARVTHAAKL